MPAKGGHILGGIRHIFDGPVKRPLGDERKAPWRFRCRYGATQAMEQIGERPWTHLIAPIAAVVGLRHGVIGSGQI